MSGPIREPVVAGQFYAAEQADLVAEIEAAYLSRLGPGEVPVVAEEGPHRLVGLVSPHAGYMYSGATAAHGFAALAADGIPEVVVIVGPSHAMTGAWAAIQTAGAWRTPLGDAVIDSEAAAALAAELPGIVDDPRAFAYEHSIEVQLPFLQDLYGERLRFLPVMIIEQGLEESRRVGAALTRVLQGRQAVIIASTDMSHQVTPAVARDQDLSLARHLEALDPEGLLQERSARRVTMCGYAPVATMLFAAKARGATRVEVLAYHHSGEVAPMDRVVGYLSAAVVAEPG